MSEMIKAYEKKYGVKFEDAPPHVKIMWQDAWQAALQSGEPEGYVLVPVEPTPKMIDAGFGYDPDENCTYRLHPAQAYRAMLSAISRQGVRSWII